MPYKGEVASKHGHSEILGNPDVQSFLSACIDIPKPSVTEFNAYFEQARKIDSFNLRLPDIILALDGSSYESSVDGRYPSRMIGYLKISAVLLDMARYEEVRGSTTRFIDPIQVAKLQKETGTISLALPGSFVQDPMCDSVRASYRLAVQRYLQSKSTELGGITLYDTLTTLIGYLGRLRSIDQIDCIAFQTCINKSCSEENPKNPIYVRIDKGFEVCSKCGEKIFVCDVLRTHEAFVENGSNIEAYNRLMSALEHLLCAHYLRYLWRESPDYLSRLCILIDGPLAIFGQSAHLHRSLMLLLDDIRKDLYSRGLEEPVIMGITKTGRVCEHFSQIDYLIPNNILFPVSDEYRYKFIEPTKFGSHKNFGDETYYGQDILVKTKRGRRFSLCLAYPFREKKGKEFKSGKVDFSNYPQLCRALCVIQTLESELYENSMIPVVLAHRHASISLKPGGKVLDVLSRGAFQA